MKFSLILLAVGMSCQANPVVDPPREPEYSCETACRNLWKLGCEEAEGTFRGGSCTDVCENANSAEIPELVWDVKALTNADVCEVR
jgi:hypothetical protein